MAEISFEGTCSVCGASGTFHRGPERSLREAFACPSCGFTQRWRDQASIILDEFGRGQALSLRQLAQSGAMDGVAIFEPALRGPFVRHLKGLPHYTQSYFWPDLALGEMTPEGVRNEDLTQLTFEDDSFDLIISSDVMEHLFDIRAAFAETLRVLRPGGIHLFSIPNDFPFPDRTTARVAMENGEEIHIKPARYHNSGDGSKCLVYTDYGADLSDLIAGLGGRLSVVRRGGAVAPCHHNATFVMRKIAGSGNRRPPAFGQSTAPASRPQSVPAPVAAPPRLTTGHAHAAPALPALKCPICKGDQFEDFNGRVNARCSGCRAVERNRMMWMLLEKLDGFEAGKRVLHMAPEMGLARRFKELSGEAHHATDVDVERYKSQIVQVRKLDLCSDLAAIPDASYDLILHSHVLEHIPCDVEATLRELDRILAPGGLHFFSVPIRGTETAEDLDPTLTEAERLRRFGQEDHYRIFGSESLTQMLKRVWGDDKHLIELTDLFDRDALRSAVIPTVAWRGISSHSIFHYRKGGTPPAVEIAAQRAQIQVQAQTQAPAAPAAPAPTPATPAPRTTLVSASGSDNAQGTATRPQHGGLDNLRRDNPWPDFPYGDHAPFHLALDCNGDGGREIILKAIHDNDITLMVEVGCFLGGSSLHWLQAKPDLTVIGVDPWENSWASYVEQMAADPSMSRHVAHLPDAEVARITWLLRRYGNFATAMNNLRLYKDRFIPVRRFSPEALSYLAMRGIPLQMIYIDAFKHREDLDAAHALFPDALLCGDDWLWPDDTGEMVMQRHIKAFARDHGYEIEDSRQSWVLHRR
ncbi:methyltransferase domain-containing protein [Pseudoruegeria sp. SHC-113]|nr:methyltransferase domain-containing protein [Pseudoruegeria sp. SHC-113]